MSSLGVLYIASLRCSYGYRIPTSSTMPELRQLCETSQIIVPFLGSACWASDQPLLSRRAALVWQVQLFEPHLAFPC